ncbi:MAG: Nif3-like dinuclear metal center hexameric protein [Campylobacterales bacterium]
MKISKILEILDKIAPFLDAEEWDNCGLLVGKQSSEVENIYLSLEATLDNIEQIEEGSLLIVHHPLIFKPLKELDFEQYPANIIELLIKKNISLIALHTNFDKHILNGYVAKKAGFEVKNSDICLEFEVSLSKEELLDMLRCNLKLKNIKLSNIPEHIKKVAFVCGAGKSFLSSISAEVLITGDVDYHSAMNAISLGKGLIDIGHYELEHYFSEALKEKLKKEEITAIIANSKNPFTYRHFQEI